MSDRGHSFHTRENRGFDIVKSTQKYALSHILMYRAYAHAVS